MSSLCLCERTVIEMAQHNVHSTDIREVPTSTISCCCNGLIGIWVASIITMGHQSTIPIAIELRIHIAVVDTGMNRGVRKHLVTRVHKRLEVIVFLKRILLSEVGQRVFLKKIIIACR